MNNEDASSKLTIYNNNDDENKNNGSNGNGKAHTKLRKETFIFIDVGGQRSERKKWMTVMKEDSQIQAVVYVVAISEFDMTCFEDNTTMRLDEALKLFEECGQNGILDDKAVTIFLNKFDLLTNKLQSIVNNTNPVQKDFKFYFNDFEGDGTDTTQILQYVRDHILIVFIKEMKRIKITNVTVNTSKIKIKAIIIIPILMTRQNHHQTTETSYAPPKALATKASSTSIGGFGGNSSNAITRSLSKLLLLKKYRSIQEGL